MLLEVILDMTNTSALITVAMLSTLLDRKHVEYLDLISPFVLSLMPREKDRRIDKNAIVSGMTNYGFEEFPMHVLQKILEKNCRQKIGYLKKSNGEYYVERIFEHEKFEASQKEMKNWLGLIMEHLRDYLMQKTKHKNISLEETQRKFTTFLESRGLDFVNDVNGLKSVTTKDYDAFHIARFILAEHAEKSNIFGCIVEVVRGYLVYKSIYYFGREQKKDFQSKLKGTTVFFDTRLLVNALGFSTNEDKIAARELLALVVSSGGLVKTFSHLKDEVAGILTKYARDPYSRATMRLEFFDLQSYGETDVMRHRGNLESAIARLGIEIIDASGHVESEKGAESCSYSVDELRTALKAQLGYSMRTASIDNDLLSLRAISVRRENTQCYGIEACKAILATTNPAFTKTANDFFKKNGKKGEVGVAIDDYDLTALLWLRSWNKKSNLPGLLLLQGAYAACRPSAELIDAFAQKVERLKREEQIDENDALILRTQIAPRDELLVLTENDANAVTDAMVISIRDNYRTQLTKDRDQQIANLQGELTVEKQKKLRALTEAEDEAHGESRAFCKRITVLTTILLTIVLLFGSGLVVYEYFSEEEGALGYIWRGVLSLIGVLGLFDLLLSKKPVLKNWIERLRYRKFSKLYSSKVVKIERYFS